jgi:hypothetical protein
MFVTPLNAVLVAVRQHRQKTRAFDGGIELALEYRAGTGQTGRNDFPVFGDEIKVSMSL